MSTKVFGVPLEQLTETDRKKHPDLRVPYIIFHSLTSIIREGVDSEGIFRISGNKERVANLKDAFDRGEEVDFIKEKTNPNDVCSLFKMYLRELPEPILTYERYDKWLELHDMRDANKQRKSIKDLIDSLPATNRAVLFSIISVLDKISQSCSLNKMDSGNLSKTVGPNLLWKEGKGDSVEYLVHSGKVNHIVQLMIDDFEHYFPYSQDESSKYTALYSKLFGHKKSVHNMIRGSHENEIWSCDSAGQIRIWDVSTFTPVKEIETEQGRIFTLNRVKNTIWTTSQKCAKVWNTETKECIRKLDFFTYCAIEVQDKAWVGSEGKIVVVNSDFETIKEIPVPGVVFCMAVDTSGKYVWAGGNDKTIRIYDIETFDLVKQLKEGHQRRVNCIVAVEDTIWTAGDDTSIFIWNAQSHTLINQFEAHAGAIYALTICGKNVWSCSWDTSIKVWNAKTLEKVHTLPNYHSDAVSSINIFYNKNRENWQAWTSSWDKSVCVWVIGQRLIPEGHSGAGEKKKKPTVAKEETKPKSAEEKMDELNKKTGELREKNTELLQKAKELKEKKHELAERREKLNKRKQELEEKKKDLSQRKEELTALQSELESNNN